MESLAAKIGPSTSTSENIQPSNPISGMSSEEKLKRAKIFARTVADSLIQCEPHHWPMLKKNNHGSFYMRILVHSPHNQM